MSEAPPPTSALMQSAPTLLLSALIPTHLPHYILLRCGCFAQILFVSVRDVWLFHSDHIRLNCWRLLWFKNQGSPPPPPPPPHVSSVWKAFMKIYFNSYVFILPSNLNAFFYKFTGQQPIFLHYQWPEEVIKQKKPASKWHQITLYER